VIQYCSQDSGVQDIGSVSFNIFDSFVKDQPIVQFTDYVRLSQSQQNDQCQKYHNAGVISNIFDNLESNHGEV